MSDPQDRPRGKLINGKTLEALTQKELTAAGIVPVAKTLVVDLLAFGYPHDKPEGLAVIDRFTIAVANDDDFGVIEGPEGGLVPKVLPQLDRVDFNTVYFLRFSSPLK